MKSFLTAVLLMMGFSSLSTVAAGQTSLDLRDLGTLQAIPAVSGHEEKLTAIIAEKLKALSPSSDSAGNVYVTFGSGTPHRLIATAIDEPGYVVSEITEDGYLRVQRLPQASPYAAFDSLQFAQPVWVMTRE